MIKVPVQVSARHIHLCQEDLERLFGAGYELKKVKDLSQENDFAAEEKVQIGTEKGRLNLRVVGPVRRETQVELSLTDALLLGIKPVLKISGEITNTPGAFILGPKGQIELNKGVIIAARHLHCSLKDAEKLNLKEEQNVSVEIKGERELIFKSIKVRVKDGYTLALHLDTDEGNAAGVDKKTYGYLNS